MDAQVILYGKRASGRVLLRALQSYIRSLELGLARTSTNEFALRYSLGAALSEAEEIEGDLVAVLNTGLEGGDTETYSVLPGSGNRKPAPPTRGPLYDL